ncbi:hypothetical protein Bca4012_060593 [Brassica carinata]
MVWIMRFSGLFSALLTVIDLSPQTMKDSVGTRLRSVQGDNWRERCLPDALYYHMRHLMALHGAVLGKCCPVLGAWLYSAYSTTALSRSIPSSAVRNATSAVTSAATMPEEDMPLLPDDSETCVDVDGMRLRRGRKGRLGRGASPSVIHLPISHGKEKFYIDIVVIGQEDCGKSTKSGHLIDKLRGFGSLRPPSTTSLNMVRGTSQDDCAVVIIVSTNGGFEAGISKDGQTCEHTLLASPLMNATTPIYYKGRYDEIIREDDNMIERSTNLDWYKGPTLLEILDQINKPKQPSDKPLRLQLQYV